MTTCPKSSLPADLQELGKKLLGPDADCMVYQANAFNLTIDERDESITFLLHTAQGDDAQQRLQRELRSDPYGVNRLKGIQTGTVVDIGGNLGTFTISAALTNPELQVVVFEPMPITYFFLKWNLFANNIHELSETEFFSGKPGVLALHDAVTKDGRDVEVEYSPTKSENGITSASASTDRVPKAYDVQEADDLRATEHSLNVPAFLRSAADILFLKIDCEGCEHEVVPDMQATGFLSHVKMGAAEVHPCLPTHSCRYDADIVKNTMHILNAHGNFSFSS